MTGDSAGFPLLSQQVACVGSRVDENHTGTIQFHFRPLSTLPNLQWLIFVAFLLLYLLSLCENTAIALTVLIHHSLQTPMYFFLGNLAALEICYASVIAPLALANHLPERKATISFNGCGTQLFFFIFLGGADCMLLAVMAFDRYVAICHPLRYTLIMSRKVCRHLIAGSLVLGSLFALQFTILLFHQQFCGNDEIDHFYCDVMPMLQLVCGSKDSLEAIVFAATFITLIVPFLMICISYVFIVAAILQIRSAVSRHHAFSTCSSHLIVVLLQYGCSIFIYSHTSSTYSPEQGRVVSVIYTFMNPVLNPLIYSMRNKELKDALRRVLWRRVLFQRK
ncbi:PREDICTED: olfactory receptor 10V1-like [Crocodylus porosus]|uniref:olfactory receptor 10V1-like n=1 Tax=Crocodylus porosus TaxID=8502 RepID=UPI00093DF16E|nr:PREDICTED: olfactory receptor 10V1-like [Crocodylus porosus]